MEMKEDSRECNTKGALATHLINNNRTYNTMKSRCIIGDVRAQTPALVRGLTKEMSCRQDKLITK